MTQEALKQMYQLLLTEPHAPTVCAQLERIAREALADHAMRETQRLGQEIEPDDISSILACRKMLDAQPVPPRTEQEPVELCQYGQEPASCTSNPMDCQCAIDAALAQPEQEPVQFKCTVIDDVHPNGIPLEQWTPPPQRKPLTDKAITQVIDSMPKKMKGFMVDWDFYDFARAIEAAHGIKENT